MVVHFEDHDEAIEVAAQDTSDLNTSLQELAGNEAEDYDSMAVK